MRIAKYFILKDRSFDLELIKEYQMPFIRDGESENLRRWSEPAQIVGITACALLVNFLIGYLISPLGFSEPFDVPSNMIEAHGVTFSFLIISFLGPFVETIVGQWLPLLVSRWLLRISTTAQIFSAAIWFSILHLQRGPAHVLQTFGLGWVLACCFIFCRRESWVKAYRATSIVHALHNAVVFIVFLLMNRGLL